MACLIKVYVATAGQPRQEDLERADWSVNAPHNLAKNPPSKDAVFRFLDSLLGWTVDGGKLCDFRFVDLHGGGTLSLVISDDAGGQADCNEVEIFDGGPLVLERYDWTGATAYLHGVEDINGDGHLELVVGEFDHIEYTGPSRGETGISHCEACRVCNEVWPQVFAWTGAGYTEVSNQYPKYYERELASLKKQIADKVHAAIWLPRPEGAEMLDLDCIKAESAKIERFLGISKDAGMDDAIRWAHSNNPAEREFATYVLWEIGTSEAMKYEQSLSHDSDRDVAKSAKWPIDRWGEHEMRSAFERDGASASPLGGLFGLPQQ